MRGAHRVPSQAFTLPPFTLAPGWGVPYIAPSLQRVHEAFVADTPLMTLRSRGCESLPNDVDAVFGPSVVDVVVCPRA